ncbi:hypothetical protein D5086_003236 [Populus alba]|uniref:Uncharacterized protein n=1 Tax=Populus alba TaxID=43335 RepID=A0ACC4D5Y9_POPAL
MMSSSSLSSSLHCFPPPSLTFQNLKNNDRLIHNFNTPLELKQLHARLIKTNTPLSILPLTKVAFVCALSPSFSYAHQIFSHILEIPQTSIWNSCLIRFAEGDCPSNALLLFYQMRLFDVLPDTFTCSFVLKACLKLSDVVNGKIIHGLFQKLGFGSNLFLQNMILNLYGLCGEMGDAMLLFEKMPQRDAVTWNIVIAQLVKRGEIDGAYGFFLRMPNKNVRSWTSMISGFVQCGKPKEAIDLFMKLEDEAVRPNEVTVVSVLAACADLEAERWEDAARVRKLMKDRGVKKTSGWSSITVNGVVHEFVAGDQTHPQAEDICKIWDKLLVKMKRRGYAPKTSVVLLDVEEKEKEKFLYRHKMASVLVGISGNLSTATKCSQIAVSQLAANLIIFSTLFG